VLDWAPPALLIPAYGLFLRAMAKRTPKRALPARDG